jgi:uncharacterized protein (TIRG00374 family)
MPEEEKSTWSGDAELAGGGGAPAREIAGWALLALAVLALVLFRFADLRHFASLFRDLDWTWVAGAALAGLGSYAAMAAGNVALARAVGAELETATLARAAWIGASVGHILPMGGVTGAAVRGQLMARAGLAPRRAAAITGLQLAIEHLVAVPVQGTAIVLLLLHEGGANAAAKDFAAVASVALSGLALGALVLSRRVRRRAVRVIARMAERGGSPALAERFRAGIGGAIADLDARPARLATPLVLALADWVAMTAMIYAGFRAIGVDISLRSCFTGFGVGTLALAIGAVPAGVGLVEGASAAAFAALGVPVDETLAALTIFRLLYDALPAVAGLLAYRLAVRRGASGPSSPAASRAP